MKCTGIIPRIADPIVQLTLLTPPNLNARALDKNIHLIILACRNINQGVLADWVARIRCLKTSQFGSFVGAASAWAVKYLVTVL
jgi:hypothetical protein